jgi:diguanylate cyclase (GGDEF)-like protein
MKDLLERSADTCSTRFSARPKGGTLAEGPTVSQLLRQVLPILDNATCLQALGRFHAERDLVALPVVDEAHRPVALLERYTFVEFLGRLYGREVFGKRRLKQLLTLGQDQPPIDRPIVVDASTPIDDVARIIMETGIKHMVSGIILVQDERYLGVANGVDLFNEITQRKQAELYHLAHYDTLTGIPNRILFTDRLTQAFLEAQRRGAQLALMFIDVDRFKQVNDSLGHRFGDHLLQDLAKRLQACTRESDTLARLGGDEFAILMDGISRPEDADLLAERMLAAVRKPFPILDRDIHVTLSIGIAVYPRDDHDVGTLLSKADAAMYETKVNGRNGFRHYSPDMSTYSAERISLEADLKQALDHDEFVLHYQPQINLNTGQVIGVEALIRWQHPALGLLSPGSFIGIAEENGLIIPIGNWVLEQACLQQRAWVEQGLPALRIAVNISSLQFRQADFGLRIRNLLKETRIRPAMLELELTESMVMCNSQQVMETLVELKMLGVRLTLDDFGTGFSSLGYLRRFPIERLKIDQSFVRNVDQIPVNKSIINAVVALARSLSMEVVAEGVETAAELGIVRECGCQETQGYFHAKPMPAETLAAWLSSAAQLPDATMPVP